VDADPFDPQFVGTVYRVTSADDQERLFSPQQLTEDSLSGVVRIERFDNARWEVRAPDTVLVGVNEHGRDALVRVIPNTHEPPVRDLEADMGPFSDPMLPHQEPLVASIVDRVMA
jgi:hypothetical protein